MESNRAPPGGAGEFPSPSEEPTIDTKENQSHLGALDIARLLGGTLEESERAKHIAHLQICRRCVESYLDYAAEMGFQRVGGPHTVSTRTVGGPAATKGLPRAKDGAPRASDSSGEGAARRVGRSGSRARAAAVAIAVVVVTAALWYGAQRLGWQRHTGVSAEVLRPIELAAGEFTRVGEVVLPGGESFIGADGPVFRSLNGRAGQLLSSSLKMLVEEFLDGSRSPDVAYWLVAGYLSSGNLRTASVYITTARERFPAEPRLKILDAAVAYFRADFARSEILLRDVIASGVDDPLAGIAEVDLALVLRDQGRNAEARKLLLSVASRRDIGPLAQRGRDLAASLDG